MLYYAMAWASVITFIGALSIELFPREIVSLFAKDTDANARELIDIATRGIRLMGICYAFIGSQVVIGNFFQAIGRPVLSIFLNLTRQLFFLLPALWLLPGWLGEPGIWLSQTTADFLSVCLGFAVLYLFFRKVFPRVDTPSEASSDTSLS